MFVFSIVRRYLFASRGDRLFGFVTLFSVLGIAIGVAAINTVQAAQNGVIAQTLAEARRGVADMTIRPQTGAFAVDPALLTLLADQPSVAHVDPFVEGQAALSSSGKTEPVIVRGIDTERLDALSLANDGLAVSELGPWSIVVPSGIESRIGAFAWAEVEMISADGQNTALGWTPRSRAFTVLGSHEINGATPTAFIALAQAQIYFRLKDQWSGITLQLETHADTASLTDALTALLAARGFAVSVETWEDINVVQADVFRVMKRVMSIVLALIMVIAGFNILASQLMLVREKRMSIAVFRTMGAGRSQLTLVFMAIGLAIGLGGVVAGLGLTLLFGWAAGAMNVTIPMAYAVGDIALIAAIAVSVCFLATLYPALRASSIDPAIALREG